MVIGFNPRFKEKILDGSKIHTLREDASNRWKAGRKMHMATGVRTKNYHCFKRDLCNGCQRVELLPKKREILIHNGIKMMRLLPQHHLFFVRNDGFDTVEEFWQWFEAEAKKYNVDVLFRKLIHWTDYRYL